MYNKDITNITNILIKCSREHQSDWQEAFLNPELSASLIEKHNLDVTEEGLTSLSPDCDAVLSCGALTAMMMNFARFIR